MQFMSGIPVPLQCYAGKFQGTRGAAFLLSLQILGTTLPVHKKLEESCCKAALKC